MRTCYTVLIICTVLLSCADKKAFPKDVIRPEKMEEIFWDYISADVYATEFVKADSIKKPLTENLRLQNELFRMHHTTKEQFYKSYDYYVSHPEMMEAMLDSMIIRQSRLKNKAKLTTTDVYE